MDTLFEEDNRMLQVYQRFMNSPVMQMYYENSNFNNVGLWEGNVNSQAKACRNLMKTLTENVYEAKGNILDVACGMGATTDFLQEEFINSTTIGINISGKQIQCCKETYPHLRFMEMDATNLQFPDEYFDVVCCVEAAFHFNTRADFIREAARVLKKNGQLIICDIVLTPDKQLNWFISEDNKERSIEDYQFLLENNGFTSDSIIDKKESTCVAYSSNLRKWALTELFYKKINPEECKYIISLSDFLNKNPINNYLFISSVKK